MVLCTVSVLLLDVLTVSRLVMQARRNIPTVPHPSETIRLVKAFLMITCATERERLIEHVERLAAEHGKFEVIEFTIDNDEPEV